MSWPFGLGFTDPSQYAQNYSFFANSMYPQDLSGNSMVNRFAGGYMNFCPSIAIFGPNLNYPIQNMHPQQNYEEPQQNDLPNSQHQISQEKSSSSEQSKQKEKQDSSFAEGEIRMVRFRRRRKVKKEKSKISHNSSLRNDTKNIPKNYGKAMLAYIQKNTRQTKELLEVHDVNFLQFMMEVKNFKNKINTIHDLREMWGENDQESKIKKCVRILSFYFMRKKCIPYIFNSRVKNYHTHIKYRKKIMQGIQNPQNFTKIKQF